jgi:hypothetical protein
VLPARLNELGETVNRDLYKVKGDVFVEKGLVGREQERPAKNEFDNGYQGGR